MTGGATLEAVSLTGQTYSNVRAQSQESLRENEDSLAAEDATRNPKSPSIKFAGAFFIETQTLVCQLASSPVGLFRRTWDEVLQLPTSPFDRLTG